MDVLYRRDRATEFGGYLTRFKEPVNRFRALLEAGAIPFSAAHRCTESAVAPPDADDADDTTAPSKPRRPRKAKAATEAK